MMQDCVGSSQNELSTVAKRPTHPSNPPFSGWPKPCRPEGSHYATTITRADENFSSAFLGVCSLYIDQV
jgi:hypothetical protein